MAATSGGIRRNPAGGSHLVSDPSNQSYPPWQRLARAVEGKGKRPSGRAIDLRFSMDKWSGPGAREVRPGMSFMTHRAKLPGAGAQLHGFRMIRRDTGPNCFR